MIAAILSAMMLVVLPVQEPVDPPSPSFTPGPPADPCASNPWADAPSFACYLDDSEAKVRLYVETYFPQESVGMAMRIAWCESRFVEDAKNPSSSASGVFQLLRGWWSGAWNPVLVPAFDPFDINENVRAASVLHQHNGWSDWYASRHCWG